VDVYLLLGSNKGNRFKNITSAIKYLKEVEQLKILECSSLYETPPEGVREIQPNYLNMALKCKTNLTPYELLEVIESIEKKLGRKNKGKKASRTIDIDILIFGDTVLETKKLKIPHPQIVERGFVIHLLYELSPDLTHPESKLTVRDLLMKDGKGSPSLYIKKEELSSAIF